jgi:hypothetical protein
LPDLVRKSDLLGWKTYFGHREALDWRGHGVVDFALRDLGWRGLLQCLLGVRGARVCGWSAKELILRCWRGRHIRIKVVHLDFLRILDRGFVRCLMLEKVGTLEEGKCLSGEKVSECFTFEEIRLTRDILLGCALVRCFDLMEEVAKHFRYQDEFFKLQLVSITQVGTSTLCSITEQNANFENACIPLLWTTCYQIRFQDFR